MITWCIIGTIIWAILLFICFYDDNDIGPSILAFFVGLFQGAFVSTLIIVGSHFAIKYW